MGKQLKITIASIVFLVVAILDIYALLTERKHLEMIAKPLLMMVLTIVYLLSVKKPNIRMVLALFFSFLGDVFLLFENDFFIFGLASFLVAQICYTKIAVTFLPKISITRMVGYAIPFMLFFVGLLYLIRDNVGDMLIPVIVYGIVISLFGVTALLVYLHERSTGSLWLFLGAFIFMLSDSIIAINRFYETKKLYEILIMITYIVAQYLICRAIISKTHFETE